MTEWLKHNSDKLILLFLVLVFTGVVLHIIHDTDDASVVNWSLTLVSGVLGSLITLITGQIANKPKSDDKKEGL